MLFNSFAFALFLPLTLVVYWGLWRSIRWQNRWLLATSYLFYGWWDWRYLFLIAGCSLVNFVAGWGIEATERRWLKHLWLTLACGLCLAVLMIFKYYNFFIESFAALFGLVGISWHPLVLSVMLPVGISFFTFQALSYTLDIFFGRLKPTHSVVDFFTFIAFFPQLVAGPIERATNLLPQFERPRRLSSEAVLHGVALMVYGLFKKMVVADTLALYVDRAFDNCLLYSSVTCVLGAFFFAIQIYCDFSGYSDVARGVARLFGFRLMINFDRPYLARSIPEFWRRWHISLSTWFKDYVYIPLGGNRVSGVLQVRNLWIVFLLSGLWHGASWTYVLWGALHALYQTVAWMRQRWFLRKPSQRWLIIFGETVAVNVAVIFAWIFFRAESFAQLCDYLGVLFSCKFATSLMALCASTGPMVFGFCWLAVGLLALSYCVPRDCRLRSTRGYLLFCVIGIVAMVFLGQPAGGEFIYFQF